MIDTFDAPYGTCVANRRPSVSNDIPLAPPVFSRRTDTAPLGSILMVRFAFGSEKITLPSGSAIGPSVPLKPSFMTCTAVPAATTPGIAEATVSMGGACAAPRPCPAAEILARTIPSATNGVRTMPQASSIVGPRAYPSAGENELNFRARTPEHERARARTSFAVARYSTVRAHTRAIIQPWNAPAFGAGSWSKALLKG